MKNCKPSLTKDHRAQISATIKKLAEEKIAGFIKKGTYEKIGRDSRRRVLLQEANNTCEVCKNSHWLGKPIWLEVHHKDDNNKNNKRGNLLVVCPNCHSAIDSNYRFRGRNHTGP